MEEEKVIIKEEQNVLPEGYNEDNNETAEPKVEQEPTQMDTTQDHSTEQPTHQSSELDAIAQLQQLSAANSQLVQAAAAALSSSGNFPFLTNFENLAAMAVAAASQENANAAVATNSIPTTTTVSTATNSAAPTPKMGNSKLKPPVDLSQLPADLLKRELMNQKVRADNRERKKRWRQQNEERNKDNDLRCRVNKRAHKLFGKEDSEHKQKWIEEEFKKRQQKRKEKERRKGLVDDSLGAHSQQQQQAGNAAANIDLSSVIAQHLNPQNTLSTLSDVNYLQLLCNNLGIPGAARTIIGSVGGSNNTEPTPTTNTTAAEQSDKDKNSLQPFSFQILEILQQLQQYQQPEQQQQDFVIDRPEEKIAALLASTLQAATAAVAASQLKEDENKTNNTTENTTTTTTTEGSEQQQEDQSNNSNAAEFPMDAVLTLMQLNAGWRQ